MDPNETLKIIIEELGNGNEAEAEYAIADLREWIAKGGFQPTNKKDREIALLMAGMTWDPNPLEPILLPETATAHPDALDRKDSE